MKNFVVLCLMFFLTACGGNGCNGNGEPIPSSSKAITAFSLAGVAGTINETAKTIAVTMPFGTDETALVATFTTTGASVKVGSTVQTSGTTANNFTNPVTYTGDSGKCFNTGLYGNCYGFFKPVNSSV